MVICGITCVIRTSRWIGLGQGIALKRLSGKDLTAKPIASIVKRRCDLKQS